MGDLFTWPFLDSDASHHNGREASRDAYKEPSTRESICPGVLARRKADRIYRFAGFSGFSGREPKLSLFIATKSTEGNRF